MKNQTLKKFTDLTIDELNIEIGLTAPNGTDYQQRSHRHQQLLDYYTTVKALMKKLSTKRTLYFYDCGCGRGYLSFYLNYLLKRDGYQNIHFICIDWNAKLITRNQEVIEKLNINNMTFVSANIFDYKFENTPDILYSLHACDTATDMMIYKGISENARHILSVSCCQHEMRRQLKSGLMGTITRHKPYKERLTDMIADSLRTLLLEIVGYKVTVFEFTSTTYTDKNVMLKCEKVGTTPIKIEIAQNEYHELSQLFEMNPKLEEYLKCHAHPSRLIR